MHTMINLIKRGVKWYFKQYAQIYEMCPDGHRYITFM